MSFFQSASSYLLNIAALFFVGFTVVFILTDFLMTLVFILPKALRHIHQGELNSKVILALFTKPTILVLIPLFLVGFSFLLDPDAGYALIASPLSIFCWMMVLPVFVLTFLFRKTHYLDDFYLSIYLEYASTSERARHNRFIERARHLSQAEASQVLEHENLNHLERKLLAEQVGNPIESALSQT